MKPCQPRCGRRSELRRRIASLLIPAQLVVLSACDRSDARMALAGDWDPVTAEEDVRLRLESDSTFTIRSGDFEGSGTYAVEEPGRIVLTPGGQLAAVVPGGYVARLRAGELTVCNTAGHCVDFVKR